MATTTNRSYPLPDPNAASAKLDVQNNLDPAITAIDADMAAVMTTAAGAASTAASAATAAAAAQGTANAALPASQKGAASGVATLDSGSHVPLAQIPPSVLIDYAYLYFMGTR